MLSLLAISLGDVQQIELPGLILAPAAEAPVPTMISAGLMDMLTQLNRMRPVVPRAATNPCAQDLARLRCADSACLKRSAESLAPACAAFLVGAPQPSPAPEPRAVGAVSSVRAGPVPRPAGGGTSGYFSITRTGPDGRIERIGGPIGGAISMPLSSSGMMAPFMPFAPGLLRALGFDLFDEEALEEDEDDDEPAHPCAREVPLCIRETHSEASAAITDCLVKHFEQLSPECKCFVHHMSQRTTAAPSDAAAAAASSSSPTVHTVGAPSARASVVVTLATDDEEGPPPHRPYHRLSCLFFFTALFVVAFLLARACVLTLCGPSKPVARRVVVVPPPEQKRVTTTPIHTRTEPANVQVAELYVKP